MKRKLFVFAMLLATTFFWLPTNSNNVSAQNRQENRQDRNRGNRQVEYDRRGTNQRKNNGTWRKKNDYGYKNYGQYRRTQVGNRRYRMVKRSYRDNGIRMTRWVRVYY